MDKNINQPLRLHELQLLGREVAGAAKFFGEAGAAADRRGEGDLPVETAGGQLAVPSPLCQSFEFTALRWR